MDSGNYIVGKLRLEEGFTTVFGKVTEVAKGIITGRREKDSHIKEEYFEISSKDVIINLGPDPHPGTVYGHEVTSRLCAKREHDFWGRYFWFYRPKKDVVSKLEEAMDNTAKLLKKLGLPALENTVLELKSKDVKGKWAGSYKHSKNPEKSPHRISLKPESMPVTAKDLTYVLLHEYAHWLHFNYVTGEKLNARWIRLFNTSIKTQTIKREQLKDMLERVVSSNVKPSDFRSDLDVDEKNQFNWIMRTIKAEHSVGLHELDILHEAECKEDIEALWPKSTLNKKDLKPVISEYATTSYFETLAEAFAYHLTKIKMPDAVVALVEKTIEQAKAKSGGKNS
jgi:hypothetical protein